MARFDVPPRDKVDAELCFSLIRRPAPYDRAPPMLLASNGINSSQWDKVMYHLARWLTRHLNDPELIIWIAKRGGQLHDRWSQLIENKLKDLASLEHGGNTSELHEIRAKAPNAVPDPLMRKLWRLLLGNRVKSPSRDFDLYRWKDRLKQEGLTTTLRLELRELLAPKVTLKKPFRWSDQEESTDQPMRLRQLVDWELVLTADYVHEIKRELTNEHCWTSALPQLLEDFQQLLRDALDLMHELGGADERRDRSFWDLPSITPHWQNRSFRDWVSLIELLRDAWLAVYSNDCVRATRIAQAWFELPYPTFKRLALFAASQEACVAPEQWVGWLLADDAWWLWSTDTGREVFRLFVLQGHRLAEATQERLEAAILAGPLRKMYREDLEPDRWQQLVDRSVWLHLAKLDSSEISLSHTAQVRLQELSDAYPKWQLADNESDEFSHWMSGTGDPDYEESRDIDIAPRKRHELVQWLKKPSPEQQFFYEDTWHDVCRTRFFHSLLALCDLSKDDVWPAERWRAALQVWSEEDMVLRSWRHAALLVKSMPDDVLQVIVHSVTSWIEIVSKSVNQQEDILLDLCRRVLELPLEASTGILRNGELVDPVTEAINHPVGHTTHALINFWFKQSPNDGDHLPADIKQFFTEICDVNVDRFCHGRVLLSSRLIALYRVDQTWTEQYLLPLYSWNNPKEAKAVWEGFLWSPRLHQPLLTALKTEFLESVKHYIELGEHRQQFAAFLTYAALDSLENYTVDDFRSAIGSLPQEGLEESAQALSQALNGAGDQREDYWTNCVQPFWQNVWPKSRDLATPRIAESLTKLIIAARSEFPSALAAMKDWLKTIEHPYYTLNLLKESDLCKKFPLDSLDLLDIVISDQQQWVTQELGQCLDEIVQTAPLLAQDDRYRRLREYLRKSGVQ
nr:hypothetical protein [Zooshikella ganghwensis]